MDLNLKAQQSYSRGSQIRPLESISDFVVEQMPGLIAIAVESKNNSAFKLAIEGLDKPDFNPRSLSEDELNVAILDLRFIEIACDTLGVETPASIKLLGDLYSALAGLPMALGYESLIFHNPAEDRRLFFNGEVGETEDLFYDGHVQIETLLTSALKNLRVVHTILGLNLDSSSNEIFEMAASNSASSIRDARETMRRLFGVLNIEHFDAFRPFFRGLRGTPNGPSGVHSGQEFSIRTLLFGERAGRAEHLKNQRHLMPKQHQGDLEYSLKSCREQKSILDLLDSKNYESDVLNAILPIMEASLTLLQSHMGVTLRAIPDLNDQDLGTAGYNAKAFLGGGIEQLAKIKKELILRSSTPEKRP